MLCTVWTILYGHLEAGSPGLMLDTAAGLHISKGEHMSDKFEGLVSDPRGDVLEW